MDIAYLLDDLLLDLGKLITQLAIPRVYHRALRQLAEQALPS
jgi:hypothetical protein